MCCSPPQPGRARRLGRSLSTRPTPRRPQAVLIRGAGHGGRGCRDAARERGRSRYRLRSTGSGRRRVANLRRNLPPLSRRPWRRASGVADGRETKEVGSPYCYAVPQPGYTVKATGVELPKEVNVGRSGGGRRDFEGPGGGGRGGGRGPGGQGPGGRGDREGDAGEYRQRVAARLDRIDDRLDRLEERLERMSERS